MYVFRKGLRNKNRAAIIDVFQEGLRNEKPDRVSCMFFSESLRHQYCTSVLGENDDLIVGGEGDGARISSG